MAAELLGASDGGAELLCVGTELLLGGITNTNARWLAEQLAALGVPHFRQEVVGDNRERLIAAVRAAAGRCRLLISTGGLGPTPDDLTTEAIAAAFGARLTERPEVWADIEAKLALRGRSPSPSLRRQALLPVGAQVLPNPTGTAPGLIWTPDPAALDFPVQPGFTLMTFPGVPSEMRAMWTATAAPWLRASGLAAGVFASRTLRFWGVAESTLAEQVADLLALENPTVAPYAGAGEVTLRITARAGSAAAAEALLAPVEAELRQRAGASCYGADGDSLAAVVLQRLRERGETLAVAESCSGGGIGAALAAVPGASDVFLGGVIAYANAVKQELLGVPAGLLAAHGAVSDPVALAMAEGARRATGATWAIAVTGIAGPGGGSAEKPVGLVHIAVAGPTGSSSEGVRFGGSRGRAWIQTLTAGEALDRLRRSLQP
ncbi:competence/damage-inducible protein A [Vulcanococcus limneticus Candia 3F8]|uniref:competence/damage-inducible protein A n=1 Tax=Vulcanococcus limneticus TaxID=2170428 RepID=UPI000B99C575|nr:competence/damage-inducible protein A [Vulcanococcus limneticus]MCP9791743.1 competence/damage-inducible protein A [Vulcanococcus limneticus MW73D5]MCP9893573.1 competence/damage-inducible protein A [Vulcanococcus limneticus Candia 3F8]MCP9897106.1 competence/damage-inducible protein A [Vulcanococcus limneticus Candia 3B3]